VCAPAIAAFPTPRGPVNDFAHVLDDASVRELTTLVRAAREQTTAEIAVVTVTSLDDLTIEEYANGLFSAWGIGKKGANNGVLVLVAPTEHKIRIEVGYGLEPVLPDGLSGEIIRTDFLPPFKNNDYAQGILQGTRHVADIVQRNHTLSPEERKALAATAENRPPALLMIPFFGVFVAFGAASVGVGVRTKTFFPIMFGGLFGGIPFLMSLIPFFNAPPFVLGPLAILMAWFGYVKGGSPAWAQAARGKPTAGAASSGWVMGGGNSGSSSGGGSGGSRGSDSGGSSGGGFGGGSSGGGGASGSW
jgi:uncharacterized protein